MENKGIETAEDYKVKGDKFYTEKDYDNAIKNYDMAIALDGNDSQVYFNKGNLYYDKEEYDKAIENYSKAIDIKPDAEAYHYIGKVYYIKKEYDKAIEYYSKEIDIDPDRERAYYYRGTSYYYKKEYDKAMKEYSKSIEIKPGYADTYCNRGNLYYNKKEYDKAINDYSKAIEINHNIHITYFAYDGRADSYEAIGEHEQAERDRKKAKTLKVRLDDEQFYNYIQSMNFNNKLELNIWELFLAVSELKQSFLNKSYTAKVAHYTKLSTLKFLINRDKKEPRLRLNNVSYMNDPSEGSVFLKLLKQVDKKVVGLVDALYGTANIGSRQKLVGKDTFLVSFSNNIDTSLPMWTQYTDDGQGACLIFNEKFFDYKDESSSIAIKQQEEFIKKNDCKECYCLYGVKYIEWDDGKQKYNIDSKVEDLIKSICERLIELNKKISRYSKNKEKLNEIIQNLLDQVRFLFKDDIYAYEKEERIIKLESDPDKVIITGDTEGFVVPHTYIEIDKPLMIDEVILGPKVKNPTEAANYIYFVNRDISVSKSRIQYQ